MFVSAAGASQFGVSWTETLGADPRTEACAVSASERSSVPRHTVFQPLRTDNVARIKKKNHRHHHRKFDPSVLPAPCHRDLLELANLFATVSPVVNPCRYGSSCWRPLCSHVHAHKRARRRAELWSFLARHEEDAEHIVDVPVPHLVYVSARPCHFISIAAPSSSTPTSTLI